jgi:hypothetical protein
VTPPRTGRQTNKERATLIFPNKLLFIKTNYTIQ